MSYAFRHAICNEAFDKWSFIEACKTIRKAGYEGIEIAPFRRDNGLRPPALPRQGPYGLATGAPANLPHLRPLTIVGWFHGRGGCSLH